MKPEAIVHTHTTTHCLNCGAAVKASYCQYCGQETVLHVPSAREFLHEFASHYVALEGKLWKSLGLLLFRPGRLTREYIEGKRVRYVLPLRLYLTFSIIFFALFKFGGFEEPVKLDASTPAAVQAEEDKEAQARREKAEKAPDQGLAAVKDDPELRGWLSAVPPSLREKTKKFENMSGEELNRKLKAAFFSYAPYAIFALMPVFALYLKILYLGSGRRYGEHMLFALHTNAFAFLMLSLLFVIPEGIPWIHPALVLWLVFYLPTAMRKVYGGSRKVTAVRWIVLMKLHLISMVVAIAGAIALGALMSA